MSPEVLVANIRNAAGSFLLFVVCAVQAPAQETTLRYDNGPFINRPAQGPGGADGSTLQVGMGVFGWPAAQSYQARVADDFTIPAGENWTISRARFFGYFPVASIDSRFSGLSLRLWDAQPDVAGSHVIWGNDSTNVLIQSAFAGAYRFRDGSPDTLRPIFTVDGAMNTTLGQGTYWLDWAFSGPTGAFGDPHQLPITIDGQTTTGNALWMPVIGNWGPAVDVGPQGFPFQIYTLVPEPSTTGLVIVASLLLVGARWIGKPVFRHEQQHDTFEQRDQPLPIEHPEL